MAYRQAAPEAPRPPLCGVECGAATERFQPDHRAGDRPSRSVDTETIAAMLSADMGIDPVDERVQVEAWVVEQGATYVLCVGIDRMAWSWRRIWVGEGSHERLYSLGCEAALTALAVRARMAGAKY